MADWDKIIEQLKIALARPVHPRGALWVGGALVLTIIGIFAAWHVTAFLVGLTVLFYVCFRDPSRVPPVADGIMVAPIDGVLTNIDRAPWPLEIGVDGEADCLTIHPRFYDVHVLRAPCGASLTLAQHVAGQWGSNVFDKVGVGNERAVLHAKLSDGRNVVIEVIGGLIPERIRFSARAGDVLTLAQPIAYSAFGGLVRLYFSGGEIIAQRGQRMVAGETPIAAIMSSRELAELSGFAA
jgi:phosphatidylserine decarboxylase